MDHTQTLVTHFLSAEDLRKIRAQLGAQHWLYQRLFQAWKRANRARRLLRGACAPAEHTDQAGN